MPNVLPDMGKFADTLITMAKAADCLPQVETELTEVLPLLADNERVQQFLSDPTIRTQGKRNAIEQIIEDDVHPALMCFFCFLIDEQLLARIGDIAESFFEKVSSMKEETSGELVSAVPLTETKIAVIEEETGNLLGKKVNLRTRIDPELLGGLYVRVGDVVIDGTLDKQLNTLRQALLS